MNLDSFLNSIRKIIPKPVFEFFQPAYHYSLAFFGALVYGFPSKRMTVIGVTGTKGKTTTCDLIAQILNSFGYRTALVTTALMRIGDEEWKNEKKQTMLGRFQLQKFLNRAEEEGCGHAVIETSSEGILQYRHKFIDYNIAVFTNIAPEHIERHKGFENYRSAKIELFEKVAKKENGIGIYNLDDVDVKYFLEPRIRTKTGYTLKEGKVLADDYGMDHIFEIKNIELGPNGSKFTIRGEQFETPLIGEFNIYNVVAAIVVALSQNIPTDKIKPVIKGAKATPGRMETVESKKGFMVVIDYAHEPFSLESIYKAAKSYKKSAKSRMVCLLGAQGGGRDKWKRPKMGSITAKYCNEIVLTNEDPYDEDPKQILSDIKSGIPDSRKIYEIIDRKEAIQKAISLVSKGDVAVLTGKGGESVMCIENNKKIPWDEKAIVMEILKDETF